VQSAAPQTGQIIGSARSMPVPVRIAPHRLPCERGLRRMDRSVRTSVDIMSLIGTISYRHSHWVNTREELLSRLTCIFGCSPSWGVLTSRFMVIGSTWMDGSFILQMNATYRCLRIGRPHPARRP
jgi:hypothetical protein